MIKLSKLLIPIRAYSTKKTKKSANFAKYIERASGQNPGISNRIKLYQDDEVAGEISANQEFQDLHEDLDEFESDFINVGKSHKMHQK